MTDSMQLPLLDPSLRTDDALHPWKPSLDAQKSARPTRDADGSFGQDAPPSSSSRGAPFARFCANTLLFAANSFLIQSAAFIGRSRFRDAWKSILDRLVGWMDLDADAAAIAREAVFVAAWTAVILAEFYLVWLAARGWLASPRRFHSTDERRGEMAKEVSCEEDGESCRDDEAADRHLDCAFVIGSTLGCAANVAAVRGMWAAAGELPPMKAWAYGLWAAVLAAALAAGCVPLLWGGRRGVTGARAVAKAGVHHETSL